MPRKSDTTAAAIAEIAGRQHGVITTRQLEAVGLGTAAIDRRVRGAQLHRIHRGVYAVGHRGISWGGRWMAAVLACGDGAVLSHASAAALWGFLRPIEGPIDVSVPSGNGRRRRAGICLHRRRAWAASPPAAAGDGRLASGPQRGSAALRPASGGERGSAHPVVRRRGIPVTTPATTVADLEGAIAPRLVRRARRQAELAGYELSLPVIRTRSDLEDDFLAFLRDNGLPAPDVNVMVGDLVVDFLWRSRRLVVETDFFGYHRGSVAFEDDHRRDMQLRRLGYVVHRYTGEQLRTHPDEIAAELREILS